MRSYARNESQGNQFSELAEVILHFSSGRLLFNNELDNLDKQLLLPSFESTGREKCTVKEIRRQSQLCSQVRVTATHLLKKRRHGNAPITGPFQHPTSFGLNEFLSDSSSGQVTNIVYYQTNV